MLTQNTLTSDSSLEIATGLWLETYSDNLIIGFRPEQVNPQLITYWANFVYQKLQKWDKSKPYLAIHEMNKPGVAM